MLIPDIVVLERKGAEGETRGSEYLLDENQMISDFWIEFRPTLLAVLLARCPDVSRLVACLAVRERCSSSADA